MAAPAAGRRVAMNALFPPPTDISTIRLRAPSLGAGVQSTTLALMAAHGEVGPMPDCAIFADTGWESKAVYEHLAWLKLPNVLPFPVHIVTAGNIRDGLVRGAQGERWASIPAFTKSASGKVGMIRRQCTKELKIVPIRRKVRELVGLTGKRSPGRPVVEQWIGISLDEIVRMKMSFEPWQVNRWPLIELGHGAPRLPALAGTARLFHAAQERLHRMSVSFRRHVAADARGGSRRLRRCCRHRPADPHRFPQSARRGVSPSLLRAARRGRSRHAGEQGTTRPLRRRM
ncbi:hypothetical protein KL86APRO_10271 [uncultured Alphaproteobacteria bacterium]|uniref:Uncharacterized protein n=1 Tax=uncultured Alphaproteobacteria bacterium TaxID=91750 RepID=A0A212IZC9_9PROT|nr:hypothetical protein KL86APRO_10271 [uncultured Alphaproteobacteria bacterium]